MIELWTPNPRTVDARPICRKCGGWSLPDKPDLRRYMSFHRACCCGEFVCPESINVTYTGIAHCDGCKKINEGGFFLERQFRSDADTVVGLDFDGEFEENGRTYCRYLASFTSAEGGYRSYFGDAESCPEPPLGEFYTGEDNVVFLDKETGDVVLILREYGSVTIFAWGDFSDLEAQGVGFGTSVNNEYHDNRPEAKTCDLHQPPGGGFFQWSVAWGGTAMVNT